MVWISKKKLEELEAERDKLQQSIDKLITSFNQNLELRQTTDRMQAENIGNLKNTVEQHNQWFIQLNSSLENLLTAVNAINGNIATLEKRVKQLEDFSHLNNKWVDLNKISN